MKTIFVTSGATVPFPQLVDLIITDVLLKELVELGFKRLIIQFGKGYDDQFVEKLETLDCRTANCSLSNTELGSSSSKGFALEIAKYKIEIIGIEYSTKIQEIINLSDLVISHAGTGSILDSIRSRKPLVVCVNDQLMDNHQQQIADRFEEKGYVWACKPILSELIECIRNSQNKILTEFPQAHNIIFEKELEKLAFY